jgi:hypothetical protein
MTKIWKLCMETCSNCFKKRSICSKITKLLPKLSLVESLINRMPKSLRVKTKKNTQLQVWKTPVSWTLSACSTSTTLRSHLTTLVKPLQALLPETPFRVVLSQPSSSKPWCPRTRTSLTGYCPKEILLLLIKLWYSSRRQRLLVIYSDKFFWSTKCKRVKKLLVWLFGSSSFSSCIGALCCKKVTKPALSPYYP